MDFPISIYIGLSTKNQKGAIISTSYVFFKHPTNTLNVHTLLPFLTYLTTIFLQPFRPTDASTLTIWNLLSDKDIIFFTKWSLMVIWMKISLQKKKVILCATQEYVMEVCFQMWDQRRFYVISYIMMIRISSLDKDNIKEWIPKNVSWQSPSKRRSRELRSKQELQPRLSTEESMNTT